MMSKKALIPALAAAVLLLPGCAPSGLSRVSQIDISSAYTRSDLSIAATRGSVPVVFSGILPASDKTKAEEAMLAALPHHYVARLAWRAGMAEDAGTRLVFAFGPTPIFPPDRLCGLKPGLTLVPPSATTPIQAAAAYCRGPSALSSSVGDVIDPAGITGERAASLIGSITNALLPLNSPNDRDDLRQPLFLRTGS